MPKAHVEVVNAPIAKESLVACKDAKHKSSLFLIRKDAEAKKHNFPENSKVLLACLMLAYSCWNCAYC